MKIIKFFIVSAIFLTIGVMAKTQTISHQPYQPAGELFQVATIGSLAQGVFDGDYSYAQLAKHGDFGVGTFNHLDGEMIAINGHFFQMTANGKLNAVTSKQLTPFAEVVFFKPSKHFLVANISNWQALVNQLNKNLPNKNIPYAIHIKGKFAYLQLRVVHAQKKPYTNLETAAKGQSVFTLKDIKGDIVGFWFPQYWAGIGVPGYHLHFISANHQLGGHVLDMKFQHNIVSIQPITQIHISLPTSKSFAHANLNATSIKANVMRAETRQKPAS